MHPTTIENVLWYCDIVLEIALCAVVFRRRVWRQLPVFVVYATALLLRDVGIYWVYAHFGYRSRAAFYSFWGTEAVLVAVRGLAIGELAWSASQLYPGFRVVLKWSLAISSGFFLIFTGVVALGKAGRLPSLILGLERNLNLTAVVALLVIFGLSEMYEISWDFPRRFVALGFFVYSAFQVANNAIPTEWLGPHFHEWNIIRVASFQIAQLLWIFALLKPFPVEEAASPAPGDLDALRVLVRDGNQLVRELSIRLSELRKAWKP